jgi:hypothetical protein
VSGSAWRCRGAPMMLLSGGARRVVSSSLAGIWRLRSGARRAGAWRASVGADNTPGVERVLAASPPASGRDSVDGVQQQQQQVMAALSAASNRRRASRPARTRRCRTTRSTAAPTRTKAERSQADGRRRRGCLDHQLRRRRADDRRRAQSAFQQRSCTAGTLK